MEGIRSTRWIAMVINLREERTTVTQEHVENARHEIIWYNLNENTLSFKPKLNPQ